jgi:hypothetical protein
VAEEWAVTTPGGQVRIGDLPLDVVVQLEGDTETEWWQIAAHPYRSAKVARYVYAACCAHVGCEPAALTLRDITEVFETVDEDLPTLYEGGIPKAASEAAPATPGSSGQPEPSTGPQT